MVGRQPWEEEDREPEVTRVRDEAINKNAIRNRMRMDHTELAPDRLSGIVSVGRDFFHTFINGTLGRRYKRPPIYLVDGWVIGALGAFMDRGRRSLPGSRASQQVRGELELGAPLVGLSPALSLFQALHQVQGLLQRVSLLKIDGATHRLEDLCLKLAIGDGDVNELAYEVQQLVELVDRAVAALRRDLLVGPHVNNDLQPLLRDAVDTMMRSASAVLSAPLPNIPGTGFTGRRPSGVLFGSIPELDIEGPAILLAPASITAWSRQFDELRRVGERLAPASMELWFGVRQAHQLPAALALVNVLHHEMTHGMVSLPTDPVQDEYELFAERWRFYDQHPNFEEGFCDATAAVCTGVTLLKALHDIKGRDLPRLNTGRYSNDWDQVARALTPLWADYYGEATSTWLQAWDGNKRDFKAFSGVISLYATNFGGLDWMRTFTAFQQGQISTGR